MHRPQAVLAISLITLAGCSSTPSPPDAESAVSGPSPTPSAEPRPTATPEEPGGPAEQSAADPAAGLPQAVIDYTNAYFAGDWETAFERLWSARCKANNDTRNEFLGTIMAQKANYPGPEKPQATGEVTVDRIDGSTALVTYSYAYQGQTQTISSQPWVLEEGAWHFDAC